MNGYEQFIMEVPDETRRIILKAMDIYHVIEEKEMICNSYLGFNPAKHEPLNKIDKRCASLFLASLLVAGDVKKIMSDCGVTAVEVFDYLGIEPTNFGTLAEEQYKQHFDEDFKLLLRQLKDAQRYICNDLEDSNFFSEIIALSMDYECECGSEVVGWIYDYAGWSDSFGVCDHASYKMIKESMKEKLESVGIRKNNSRNYDYGFGSQSYLDNERPSSNNILQKYGEFLTEKEYPTNPAIGREKEIRNLMLAVLTPEKSAILIGEAGVGKTAIAEGFAYLIKNKQVPKLLEDVKIVKMNTSAILSGCMYVGMFEERVETIIKELIKQQNVILFIDEIHNVIGAGSSSKKDMDLANILKPYLDRGQIKMIGATTNEEYEEHILKDSAFKRRFERVNVLEPGEIVVGKILSGTIPKIEQATKVRFEFSPEEQAKLIDYIVMCTNKKYRVYNDNVNNPDLSLAILKKAFAFAALYGFDTVQIEHIAESIRNCERINESTRNRQANALIATFQIDKEQLSDSSCRVIRFPASI